MVSSDHYKMRSRGKRAGSIATFLSAHDIIDFFEDVLDSGWIGLTSLHLLSTLLCVWSLQGDQSIS